MTDPYAQRREGPLRRETDWSGRRVVIMGLGLFGGGLGAADYALGLGADVVVTDLRGESELARSLEALRSLPRGGEVELVLREHREADFRGADIVIVNPAVPPSAPMLAIARERARITTATELLLGALDCRVVGITGTHGKSSTVQFTKGLLEAACEPDVRVVVGGNIGGSLLGEIEALRRRDIVILEISSYQLEHLSNEFLALTRRERALDVAAITNIGVDHLARHGSVEAYRAAKHRIAALTGPDGFRPGTIIAPAAERGALEAYSRVFVHDADGAGAPGDDQLRVPGDFQRQNLAAAYAIGRTLGASPERMTGAIPSLEGLPHRLEALGTFVDATGLRLSVVDNGVSTTPESAAAALESLGSPNGARVVLVGGIAKRGCDFGALGEAAARLGWTVAPFGHSAAAVAEAARAAGARVIAPKALGDQDRDSQWPGDVEEAVRAATLHAQEHLAGASEGPQKRLNLLLSPACASFDRYPNFRARALAFRAAVAALADPEVPTATERTD